MEVVIDQREEGQLLQVATADELGGRLNRTGRGGKVELNREKIIKEADDDYKSIDAMRVSNCPPEWEHAIPARQGGQGAVALSRHLRSTAHGGVLNPAYGINVKERVAGEGPDIRQICRQGRLMADEGQEFFYLDKDGTKQDAELHNAILNPVDFHDADEKIMNPIREKNRKKWLAEQGAMQKAARLKSQWARTKARSLRLLHRYDPSQPRDDHGEWTSGGGGGGDGGGSSGESARREGESDKQFAKRVVDKRPAPKELPEKHEDYFKMEGATVMPLDKLVSGKSAEENKQGGDNGAKRMAAAAKGELAKRDPITVEPMGDGKYLITDGNGTFTTVQKYGWKAIPVQFAGGVDATHQAYKPGKPGLKADASTVKKVRQQWVDESPIKTMDDVKRDAPIAQATLGKIGNAVAAKFGVEYVHPTAKTQKIDKATGKIVENPKGVNRILEKIAKTEKATGQKTPMARVTDAARGTFVLNQPSDARKVVDELAKSYELIDEGWRTIPNTYYTDRPLLFRDPATGMIGEIQLANPDLLKAKDKGGGHEMYEEARSLPATDPRVNVLDQQMQALYGKVLDNLSPAWKEIDGRLKRQHY